MPKVDISVGELVDMIRRGELRLPELQRRYVWPATRVRDLLDSLYRGYPSGTILVWETDLDIPTRELAVAHDTPAFGGQKLLLDGQQRLTSLSAVVRGEPLRLRHRVRPVEIAFNLNHPEGLSRDLEEVLDDNPLTGDELDLEEADSEDESPGETGIRANIQNSTFVVATKALLRNPHWVKVSDIFSHDVRDWDILRPLGVMPDDPSWDLYTQRLQAVRRIRDYQYVMQVVERDLSYEEVAEIFVRVNALGTKLRGSDLALAQVTAKWPHSLGLFESFAEECERAWSLVRAMVVFATGQCRFRTVGSIKPLNFLKTKAFPYQNYGKTERVLSPSPCHLQIVITLASRIRRSCRPRFL